MQPEDLALATVQAINDRDRKQLDKLALEDIQLFFPPGMVFYGRQGLTDFFNELERRVPDLTLAAREVLSGDNFAVVEWESSGADTESMGCLVLKTRDGMVSRARLYLDTAHWQRLGG
ncbi:MAG TPA: nuclear transport factor 2 family protein [Candidatus Dormibacteraeota bacterium]